ncbi:hypothetical protein [Sphingomonas carotinifaciens]|uniref:hypothetical protein n=1 Tax=Sphingomonas carotinifaciens TaxID=1166323 RepID=UPI001396907C|nr:hypothetical protein [Sphingomonas carotinifaciens]MBB4087256.1 hypothetical protein [Sphingomonas carotinifaciens]
MNEWQKLVRESWPWMAAMRLLTERPLLHAPSNLLSAHRNDRHLSGRPKVFVHHDAYRQMSDKRVALNRLERGIAKGDRVFEYANAERCSHGRDLGELIVSSQCKARQAEQR